MGKKITRLAVKYKRQRKERITEIRQESYVAEAIRIHESNGATVRIVGTREI